MSVKHISKLSLAALLVAAFALTTGCDSSGANEAEDGLTIEGRATDDSGYSKSRGRIEGAAVTAVSVEADGSRRNLSGKTTTDAEGHFRLETDAATPKVLILRAETESFATSALVYAEGRSSVHAMPMTAESHAEADVYVEARNQASYFEARDQASRGATIADVAAFVDTQVAASIQAGQTTAEKVAAAVRSSVEAEVAYAKEASPDVHEDEAREQKLEAFFTLQAALAASSNTAAQVEATEAFEARLARAYVEAGASAEAQAKASLAARLVLSPVGSDAGLALRKRAEVIAALATTHAVEAAFEAGGATQARIDAVAAAGATLLAELRAVTLEGYQSQVDAAHATYQSSVEAELSNELDVDASAISEAQASFSVAEQILTNMLSVTGSAKAITEAYSAFYTHAEASARRSFSGNAKASLAATVLVLLSAQ